MNKEIVAIRDRLVKEMQSDKLFSVKQFLRAIELNGLCKRLEK